MADEREQDPKKDERVHLAVVAAIAYHASAHPFIQYLSGLSKEEGERQALAQLGKVIVTATNLAFAVELYLKVLCLLEKERPPEGGSSHNLMKHYSMISSSKSLATVEAIYAGLLKERKTPKGKLVVNLPRTGDSTPAPRSPETTYDASFRAVLEDSKDVFKHWRYLYNRSLPNEIRRLTFHFDCLNLIAEALDTHLTTVFGGRLAMEAVESPPTHE